MSDTQSTQLADTKPMNTQPMDIQPMDNPLDTKTDSMLPQQSQSQPLMQLEEPPPPLLSQLSASQESELQTQPQQPELQTQPSNQNQLLRNSKSRCKDVHRKC